MTADSPRSAEGRKMEVVSIESFSILCIKPKRAAENWEAKLRC